MAAWTQDLSMRAIRFIIMAVALPKGRFLAASHGPGGAGRALRPDTRVAYPDNSLSRWGAPRSTCQLFPKRKPGWRKKCRSGGVYYKRDGVQRTRRVCGLPFSLRFPYTDRQQKRLFIRNFFTLQDRWI